MTQDITLHCNRVKADEVYVRPESEGLLIQVSQDGSWSQVVLTRADALRLAEHIIMHVPRGRTNAH